MAESFLRGKIEELEASDWQALGERIARLGYWEFVDYQP